MSSAQTSVPYGFCHCGCGGRTNISPRNNPKLGHTKGEPYRYICNHDKRRSLGPIEPMDEVEYQRRYRQRSGDAPVKRWVSRNRTKYLAHKKVWYAVKSGKLIRQPCEVCGAKNVHAHHDDYSKPLEVRWLCPRHHTEVHRG